MTAFRMRSWRLGLLLPLLLTYTACADGVRDRLDHAASLARHGGLSATKLTGGQFTLAVFHRIAAPSEPVAVYIEGDGFAWASRRRLSDDPTPRDATGLALAAADPEPNVLYIGRPCQYGGVTSDRTCHSRYWSSHRFAPEVVAATAEALDQALARFGGQGIDLVGYSGGAAVAALLAAQRSDIRSLRTVAGNLDHVAVNKAHGVSPLFGSLNAIDVAGHLSSLPQIHFAGAEDQIVPPSIAQAFAAAVGPCAQARVVPEAQHGEGWAELWPDLLAQAPSCR